VSDVLIISGSMGAGKTTILAEASDLLRAANIPHAAIDVDALGIFHARVDRATDVALRNLTAVWSNYAALGIDRLLLAEAIDSPARRDALRQAVGATTVVVCRLRASLENDARARKYARAGHAP
jgi:hypothetical protein